MFSKKLSNDINYYLLKKQIISFSILNTLINPGGYYIIEDFDEKHLLDEDLISAYRFIASNNDFTFQIFETGRNNSSDLTDDILLIFRKK